MAFSSDQPNVIRAALRAVEAKTCDIHVFRLLGCAQQLQDTHALPNMIGAYPKPFAPKATDYSFSVKVEPIVN